MIRRVRRVAGLVAAIALVAVGGSVAEVARAVDTAASAERAATRQIVKSYAPIVMLGDPQLPPCDKGEEQYGPPTTVDVVLGNPRVKLVRTGPGTGKKWTVVTTAPTAADIAGRGDDYFLDLPGDTLNARCTYGRDFARIRKAGRAPAVAYAHIARQAGHSGFVVQYWFFYYFNQFNDVHEGDWEGMQIAFDAETAQQALLAGPDRIVVFQHAGGDLADWGDDKVEKKGTHPVVYPAAGSHATFFSSSLYLGNGQGGSGLGCDDTSAPLRRSDVRPVTVPTTPAASSRFAWLTFTGRWGQRESGFNNGPTGPNTKTQWLQPFDWMEGLRSNTPQLPGGSIIGPTVTGAFCTVAAAASGFFNYATRTPTGAAAWGFGLIMLAVVLLLLTRWRPIELDRLRRRRAFGQLVRTARQFYGRHWRVFVLIGLTAMPLIGVVEGLQWVFEQVVGGSVGASAGPTDTRDALAESISSGGRLVVSTLVTAAAIVAVRSVERGETTGWASAYRALRPCAWRVIFSQLAAEAMVLLMAITIIGIPFALWKFVSWQLVQQEIIFEDRSLRAAFRGSSKVVRGSWWHTAGFALLLFLLSIVPGPAIALALIFTDIPLIWVNILGAVIFALLIPYVAIGRTLLYFDLGVRRAQAQAAPRTRRRRWSLRRSSPQTS